MVTTKYTSGPEQIENGYRYLDQSCLAMVRLMNYKSPEKINLHICFVTSDFVKAKLSYFGAFNI